MRTPSRDDAHATWSRKSASNAWFRPFGMYATLEETIASGCLAWMWLWIKLSYSLNLGIHMQAMKTYS